MGMRGVLSIGVVGVLCALWPAAAAAGQASGPRETIDQSFTTTAPATPTGVSYSGTYHAADDPNGIPPFLRRLVFYPPPGMTFDTSVPDRCTASDAELQVRGPDACPPGSLIGTGNAQGIVFLPFTGGEFHRYTHDVFVLNNAGEQILLVQSEGYTVTRGSVAPDGTVDFSPPTCFPHPSTGCPDDNVLQLSSSTFLPAYTRDTADGPRSYATTPATCPDTGNWQSRVRFWWSDDAVDDVVTTQPCSAG